MTSPAAGNPAVINPDPPPAVPQGRSHIQPEQIRGVALSSTACRNVGGMCEASQHAKRLANDLIGNLVEDPELRFTPNGVPVARFTVASTPRTFDREANAWQNGETTFLDCTALRQLAENLTESLAKGARVVVAGRLCTDRWESPEGEKRSRMVLDVDDIGASMTFATIAITRTSRSVQLRDAAPDDPWASASRTRPAPIFADAVSDSADTRTGPPS